MKRTHIFILLITLVFCSAILYFFVGSGLDALQGNVRIVFHGILIDQNGAPVVGACVKGYVQAERWLSVPIMGVNNSTKHEVSAETDSRGNFLIAGVHGQALYIREMLASGYSDFSGADVYYGDLKSPPYKPDINHPQVFHVWKRLGADHLPRKGIPDFPGKADGRIYVFDLVKQIHHEGNDDLGDLKVSLNALPPENSGLVKLHMEGIGGGLVAYKGRFPYEAPANGYVPSMTFDVDTKHYSAPLSNYYYLRSRDGKVYAVFMIGVRTFSGSLFIGLDYRINTTGSRILEP